MHFLYVEVVEVMAVRMVQCVNQRQAQDDSLKWPIVGGWGETLVHKMWIICRFFFGTIPLVTLTRALAKQSDRLAITDPLVIQQSIDTGKVLVSLSGISTDRSFEDSILDTRVTHRGSYIRHEDSTPRILLCRISVSLTIGSSHRPRESQCSS